MISTLRLATPSTHVKIVVLALICSIAGMDVAIHARSVESVGARARIEAAHAVFNTLNNRTAYFGKGNRLSPVRPGASGPAVLRTDGAANTSVVMKNSPGARDAAQFRAPPAKSSSSPAAQSPAANSKALIACERAFSTLAASKSWNFNARCVAGLHGSERQDAS